MHTVGVECPPFRSQAWLDDHAGELEGLPVDAAVAVIEGAGLQVRVMRYPGGWMTQEQRTDRITLWSTEAGDVGAIEAG